MNMLSLYLYSISISLSLYSRLTKKQAKNTECLEKNNKHSRINIVGLLWETYVYVSVYYSVCSSDPPSQIGSRDTKKSIKSSKDDNRLEMASVKATIK